VDRIRGISALLTILWVRFEGSGDRPPRARARRRRSCRSPSPRKTALPLTGEPHLRVPPAAVPPIPLPFSRSTPRCRVQRRSPQPKSILLPGMLLRSTCPILDGGPKPSPRPSTETSGAPNLLARIDGDPIYAERAILACATDRRVKLISATGGILTTRRILFSGRIFRWHRT
jgi:hypothetical protein